MENKFIDNQGNSVIFKATLLPHGKKYQFGEMTPESGGRECWIEKLIVPDRGMKGLELYHEYILTGYTHDTKPRDWSRGVVFVIGYHDPQKCAVCNGTEPAPEIRGGLDALGYRTSDGLHWKTGKSSSFSAFSLKL